MCYSIPGKVVEIIGNSAIVDYFGEKKKVFADAEKLKKGDYVLAQGGVAVETITPKNAKTILSSWKEVFKRLKARDSELTAISTLPAASPRMQAIAEKAVAAQELTREDMLFAINAAGVDAELLYSTANRIRAEKQGNSSCVHGIIEFSNYCSSPCSYCGINSTNAKLTRYRMTPEEIIETAVNASKELGFKAIVLQSGEDAYYTAELLETIIRGILKETPMLLILSIGERNIDEYKRLYKAGSRGILMRFETSNENIYKTLHASTLDERINLIKALKGMGYVVTTGFLTGLPQVSNDDAINDMLLSKELSPEMHSSGPFITHAETILKEAKTPSLEYSLNTLALLRLIDAQKSLLVTTAFESLYGAESVRKALLSGANSMMLNLTPLEYRHLYGIYPGKEKGGDIKNEISGKIALLTELGRAPSDIGI